MKSFKQFLEAKNTPVPIADYVPEHGGHTKEKQHKNPPVADYTPEHGSHAKPSQVKESADTNGYYEFIGHNPNTRIGSTHDLVHEKLNPSEERWEKKPASHRNAVREYTGGSRWLNHELVTQSHGRESTFAHKDEDAGWEKSLKTDNAKKFPKVVKGLDSFLNKSKVKSDMTVFHGISAQASQNFHPGELANQHPDRHIKMPAYLSTSIHPSIAASFAKPRYAGEPTTSHILKIHLKKGQSGYHYLGDRSEFPKEKEGLLARGKTMKIGEHPTVLHHPEGGQVHVWDAHIVD